MSLQIGWSGEVLQALAERAPAGGDTWVTLEEVIRGTSAGLGMGAINLKAAVRSGYAEVRDRENGQPEYRSTATLATSSGEGAMFDSSREDRLDGSQPA